MFFITLKCYVHTPISFTEIVPKICIHVWATNQGGGPVANPSNG